MAADLIDFRSDVKTLPTEEMLEAMRSAELGDSKAGEDPTVKRLEEMAAERFGVEAAMLLISGTMANLAAIMAMAEPGEGMVLDPESHIYFYEGAHSLMSGVEHVLVKSHKGMLDPDELAESVQANRDTAKLRLICLENTHNRSGGRVILIELHARLCEIAHENGMAVHVDGARIFNASVASGVPVSEYARHVDSIMFCLSKSLSCPLGSVLCGSSEFMERACRASRRLGGGMRQAGLIAAAGTVALESMVARLAEDHANAKRLAEGLREIEGFEIDMETVETNMVNVGLSSRGRTIEDWVEACRQAGVLIGVHRPDKLRLVTHRHHSPEIVDEAVRRVRVASESFS